jgi:hypothetical protein
VNHFQPSFKLATKSRDGAKVRKRYHPPATPYLARGDQAGTGPTIRMTDKAGVATRGGRSPTGVTTLATARS